MKLKTLTIVGLLIPLAISTLHAEKAAWSIDNEKDWKDNINSSEGAVIEKGSVAPKAKAATVLTKIQTFDAKRSAKSLTIAQSSIWQNWSPTTNLGPANLQDAPVLLTKGPDDYWMFGRYGGGKPKRKKGADPKARAKFTPE